MAQTKLNMVLLLRRDDFTTESKKDYVLLAGEPGYCTATKTFKVGDGSTTWENLDFANKELVRNILTNYYTNEEVDQLLAGKLDVATYNTDKDTFALKVDIQTEFAKYTTTEAQTAIDSEQDRRLGLIETELDTHGDIVTHSAADFATATQGTTADATAATVATYGDIVTHNVAEFATNAQGIKADNAAAAIATYGDIVTHNAVEFEAAGAASAAEDRINETLKSYYTKTEANTEFATPVEVITEINKALADVSNTDTITNITTLVEYVNENAEDLTGLITEVYGSAEMTGDSRLDLIEAKAAMEITADDIDAWNTEKGVKAVVDANKATWDKAGTALQAADLADYAKTADVVTNDEFTAFETTNTVAINAKLDKSTFEAFNNGTSTTVAAIEADIVAKAGAAESAAKGHADSLNTAMDARVAKLENNEADYTTKEYVDTQDADILAQAKAYADGKPHENTTYEFAATTTPLQFTVTPSEGDAQTVTLLAPYVDTGIMSVEADTDIVVTPGENGKVTVGHKIYGTGTYTKPDTVNDANFVTGVTVENGHIKGATVKSLAEALMSMEFILDGGNAETV